MDKLKCYSIVGVIFTVVMGVIGHFVYDLAGENFIAGLFFPVNESTWEHMKLVFFPMLLYSLFAEHKLKGESECISKAFMLGILAGTFAIPVIFYTYSGILGYNLAWLNILTFVVSVIIGFIVVYILAKKCKDDKGTWILKGIIFALVIAFMIFSYYPPNIGLFTEELSAEAFSWH
ncbi:MAG: hypothetical protein E7261_09215 [Lachnospiraceae bacterium]|nr:hypothetical protein [Lachnospiraceae bacterium]